MTTAGAVASSPSSEPREPSGPSWAPILSGADAVRAGAAIDAIAHDLRALDPLSLGPTLSSGAAGVALFFACLGEARADEAALADAERWLDAALERWGALASRPGSLFAGTTGVAWAVIQLCDEEAAEQVCSAIDPSLEEELARPPESRHYDLILGLVGIGIYLLASPPSRRRRSQLETVLHQLERLAVADRGGLAWFTPAELLPEWQRQICPQGHFNLGLAHGVPGVIGLLSRLLQAGFEPERVSRLLAGAMHWTLSISSASVEGRYPSWCGVGAPDTPARLAWCYGDPGVALALLSAARAAGRDDWHAEALALSRLITRRPPQSTMVCDGGLCHGAAGLGHIMNRLSQALNEPIVRDGARYWFAQLLDLRRPGEGHGGFLVYDPEVELHWSAAAGVLSGSAGVGLALLAATSDQAPSWDAPLLMDV